MRSVVTCGMYGKVCGEEGSVREDKGGERRATRGWGSIAEDVLAV